MIYGDILHEQKYQTSISESLNPINEEYIEFKPAAKGADSASMFFMIGANNTHLNSPRYKAAGDKKLFNTKNCYEID